MAIKPIRFENDTLLLIDQRLLPNQEVWLSYKDAEGVAEAIRSMVVRGAPAIGVTAAYGAAFGADAIYAVDFIEFFEEFNDVCDLLAATRPTAVNLCWALERMKTCARAHADLPGSELKAALFAEAHAIAAEDEILNRAMGAHGQELIPDGSRILTHCNAGALATGGFGTALGVIRAAVEAGKSVSVIADETRPWLQGARLTAWELMQDGIPVTLICDNMAGYLMSKGEIDCVIVGADRIAANGDTANKIGTYSVAILAKEHDIPFYVAAPLSTIDRSLSDGSLIPIEERSPDEVTHCGGHPIAPAGVTVCNPAFDITPARYISAIITERGVATADFQIALAGLFTR
ncbi:MAG: S-methyl-5-thioribose-1-phosphate isomerase [Deltaproteobacteria bacterium HGW-Deltaproteobacteria-4]|nr:MAG: S-methyl-5-thioribose-1-phosphate isomerase [Deltaproteobacteria bacterium HGW-Deltaproteobacteria-4]